MLGHRVHLTLTAPDENISGELRQHRAYRCGMCEEEFYVEHVGDVKPTDTACPNCGSDETELDLPACLPEGG